MIKVNAFLTFALYESVQLHASAHFTKYEIPLYLDCEHTKGGLVTAVSPFLDKQRIIVVAFIIHLTSFYIKM